MPAARITGIDLDPGMVAIAQERIAAAGLGDQVRTIVGDAADLPLHDDTIDLATSTFSVHHWPDPAAGFAELRRVLRPGARLVVYDLPDLWGRFETGAPPMPQSVRAAGFSDVRSSAMRWPGSVGLIRRVAAVKM